MESVKKMIYFDHAAATPPVPDLLQEFAGYPAKFFYNPESVHPGGLALRAELNRRCEALALQLFGEKQVEDEFYFGSGASEVFNLLSGCSFPECGNVVSTELEHPAAKYNLARLPGEKRFLPVDGQGRVILSEIPRVVDDKTSLVLFHQVHNELGTIQEWTEIIAAIRSINATSMIVVDAVQAAGKFPLCSEADMLVISGHKFGAAVGGGAAIFNCRSRYAKMLHSAAEKRRREYYAGRVEVANAMALIAALTRAECKREQNCNLVAKLNKYLRMELMRLELPLNHKKIKLTVPFEKASPYILHLLVPDYQGAVLVRYLGKYGICLSSGSACQTEAGGPNQNLLALGYKPASAYSALRLSFSAMNTEAEATEFIRCFQQVLQAY